MPTTMKSSIHLGLQIQRELGCIQEYQLRGAQDVVRKNAETDRGTIIRDSDCMYDDVYFLSLGWNLLCVMIKSSSGRKQGYMSTQIQSCVWGAWSFWSDWKMEKPDPRIPTIQRVRRVVWNRWRTNWVRVKYFLRIHISWDSWRDPERSESSTNPEQFEGRILFMSMFNDIDWTKNWNSLHCILNSKEVRDHAKRFQLGQKSFLAAGNEEKWYGTLVSRKENETMKPRRWLSTSNKVVVPYSEVQVRSTQESWGEIQ